MNVKTIIGKFRLAHMAAIIAAPLLLATAHPGADSAALPILSAVQSQIAVPTTAVATVDAFHAALKRGDTAFALMLLSQDALIFESGAVESNRAEYESHHLKADAEFSAATARELVSERLTTEGDMATVMRVELINGSFRGRPINSRSIETMVLRKTDAGWRIVHIHWSSANLKA
jgi:ketosteroid isomerase-like protein